MKRQILKALEIAALTGDKVIVVNEKTDKGMVVMGLDEYEKFLKKDDFDDEDYGFLDDEEEKNDIDNEEFGHLEDFLEESDEEFPLNEEVVTEDSLESNESIQESPILEEESVDEDENVYYYQEPEEEKEEMKKEDNGFTSIKEELKERRKWDIPSSIKKGAEEVINKD